MEARLFIKMSAILKLGGLGKRNAHRKTMSKGIDGIPNERPEVKPKIVLDDSDSPINKPARKGMTLVRSRSTSMEPRGTILDYQISPDNRDSSSPTTTPPSINQSPPCSPRTSDGVDFEFIEQDGILLSPEIVIPIKRSIENKFDPNISNQLPTLVESSLIASSITSMERSKVAKRELETITELSKDVLRKSAELHNISSSIFEKSQEALNAFEETKATLDDLSHTHRSISSHFMYFILWLFSLLFSVLRGIQKLTIRIIGIENKKDDLSQKSENKVFR